MVDTSNNESKVSIMQKAKELARKNIESTYEGSCTIYEYQKIKDEVTGLTRQELVVVLEQQPCRVSFEHIASATQGEMVSSITQSIKLFLSPDIIVKAGSNITVTQAGKTTEYIASGIPAIYDTHQEIMLVLSKERA